MGFPQHIWHTAFICWTSKFQNLSTMVRGWHFRYINRPQQKNLQKWNYWNSEMNTYHGLFYSAATILITKTGRSTRWNGTSWSLGLAARWKNKKKPLFLGRNDQISILRTRWSTSTRTTQANKSRSKRSTKGPGSKFWWVQTDKTNSSQSESFLEMRQSHNQLPIDTFQTL